MSIYQKSIQWLYSLIFCVLLFPAQAAMQPIADQDVIKNTVNLTIAELAKHRAEIQADPSQLYPLIQRTVVPGFDFERITRSAMGPFWRKASATQRTALTRAFQQLLVRTYAQALLSYPNPQITYLPVRIAKNGKKMLAPTQVLDKQGQAVPINYRLHWHASERWLIYDVVVEGISLITNYRSTFKSMIRQGSARAKDRTTRIAVGIDHLISTLQSKNAQYNS
jgi:phospholipid transport system substrate-binding protein